MKENAVRESIHTGFVNVKHIEGNSNLADLFTKEDKDTQHFLQIRNKIMPPFPEYQYDDHDSIAKLTSLNSSQSPTSREHHSDYSITAKGGDDNLRT